MIGNITAGNSFNGLIMYNEKKVQKGQAERLYSNYFNIEKSCESLIAGLERVADNYRAALKNKTFHVSLSLAETDKVSQDGLVEIGNKYMEKMGYGETPFIIYRHHDTGIDHLHIVSTRVDLDGNKVNDSMERLRSQRVARALELEYGMTVVSSVKERPDDLKRALEKEDNQDVINTKHAISLAIHHVLNTDKATNYEDFVSSLAKRNVIVQLVRVDGKGSKLVIPGIMYSLGKKGVPESKRVKGSAFAQGYTYTKVLNQLNTNLILEQTKPVFERSKADLKKVAVAILAELKSPLLSTIEDLDQLFAKYKLEGVYFKNSGGISGLSIKDLTNNQVYKASDIDRGFSWNVIQKFVDGTEGDLEKAISRDKRIIPFTVYVAPDPNDEPLVWIKSPMDKAYIASPIIHVANELSKRGFVSQNELNIGLRAVGFKATFSRDFSKSEGGITSVAFTELATGKTYSGFGLNHKQLSWTNLSRFVADDRAESTFTNYVKFVLTEWNKIKAVAPVEKIEDFTHYINQYGITLSKFNDVEYLSQIGGDMKVPLVIFANDNKLRGFLEVKQPRFEAGSLATLNAVGYLHKPLEPLERALLSAVYNNDRNELIKLVNAGDRIDLGKVELLAAAASGENTYKQIINVQQQIAKTLKFALFCNLVKQEEQPSASGVKLPFETFVQSLNKRGIGVRFDLDSTGRVESITFHLRGNPNAVLHQNELPDFIKSSKLDETINLQSTGAYKDMLDEKGGFEINYSAKQVELFKAIESDNNKIESNLRSQGVTLVVSDMDADYFDVQDVLEQEFEESINYSESFIKGIISFIDALAQVAQGEIPVSRDTSKKKKENPKRRRPRRY
jgi:hypothetical protein